MPPKPHSKKNTCSNDDESAHDLKTLLDKMKEEINKNTNDRIGELSLELQGIRAELDDQKNEQKIMKKQIDETVNKLERLECHSRKYNLLIYGLNLPDTEEGTHNVENHLRKLFVEKLKIQSEVSQAIFICNAHILPKPTNSTSNGPNPIIVKFAKFSEKQLVLGAAQNLKKADRIGIRTDISRNLNIKRAQLAQKAYKMRESDANLRTRIRESIQIPDVWMEVKQKNDSSWKKF